MIWLLIIISLFFNTEIFSSELNAQKKKKHISDTQSFEKFIELSNKKEDIVENLSYFHKDLKIGNYLNYYPYGDVTVAITDKLPDEFFKDIDIKLNDYNGDNKLGIFDKEFWNEVKKIQSLNIKFGFLIDGQTMGYGGLYSHNENMILIRQSSPISTMYHEIRHYEQKKALDDYLLKYNPKMSLFSYECREKIRTILNELDSVLSEIKPLKNKILSMKWPDTRGNFDNVRKMVRLAKYYRHNILEHDLKYPLDFNVSDIKCPVIIESFLKSFISNYQNSIEKFELTEIPPTRAGTQEYIAMIDNFFIQREFFKSELSHMPFKDDFCSSVGSLHLHGLCETNDTSNRSIIPKSLGEHFADYGLFDIHVHNVKIFFESLFSNN